jgi:ferredoxin-NADP reductase
VERTALLRRLTWQTGTVISTTFETPRVKTITLAVTDWRGHRAGQHVDVRFGGTGG